MQKPPARGTVAIWHSIRRSVLRCAQPNLRRGLNLGRGLVEGQVQTAGAARGVVLAQHALGGGAIQGRLGAAHQFGGIGVAGGDRCARLLDGGAGGAAIHTVGGGALLALTIALLGRLHVCHVIDSSQT